MMKITYHADIVSIQQNLRELGVITGVVAVGCVRIVFTFSGFEPTTQLRPQEPYLDSC